MLTLVEEHKDNLGMYRGYMLAGRKHGPGTYKFNNLSIYNGEFAED